MTMCSTVSSTLARYEIESKCQHRQQTSARTHTLLFPTHTPSPRTHAQSRTCNITVMHSPPTTSQQQGYLPLYVLECVITRLHFCGRRCAWLPYALACIAEAVAATGDQLSVTQWVEACERFGPAEGEAMYMRAAWLMSRRCVSDQQKKKTRAIRLDNQEGVPAHSLTTH